MAGSTWAKHFGLNEDELQTLINEYGSEEGALRFAMRSGRIDEAAYFAWAMRAYLMPLVKTAFFEAPIDPRFWDYVDSEFNWHSLLVPLAEWDGTLLIGCPIPPRELEYKKPHRFVLASPTLLERHWNNLNPAKKVPGNTQPSIEASISAPESEAPEGFSAAVPGDSAASSDAPEGLSFSDAPEGNFEAPEGFSFDSSAASGLNFSSSTSEEPERSEPESIDATAQLPDGFAAPDGFSSNASASELNFDFSTSGSFEVTQPNVEPEPAPVAPPPQTPPPKPDVRANAQAAPVPPPPPVKEFSVTADAPAMPQTSQGTTGNISEAITNSSVSSVSLQELTRAFELTNQKNAPNLQSVVKAGDADVSLDAVSSYDELGSAGLAQVLKIYEHGMILLFQKGELRPWKWTELLLSVKGDAPSAIDLTSASIFRIVYRTTLPYHGYVVSSPVNDTFFKDFYRGKLPKLVTITPIMTGGKQAGMLMGITEADVNFKASLRRMEELTQGISKTLERLRAAKKAA